VALVHDGVAQPCRCSRVGHIIKSSTAIVFTESCRLLHWWNRGTVAVKDFELKWVKRVGKVAALTFDRP